MKPENDLHYLTVFAAAIVIVPALLLYHGWALSTLWGWFLAPLGLPAIGVAHATGIVMLLGATRSKGNWIRAEYRHLDRETWATLTAPALAVGIGSVLRWWL